MKKRLYKEAKYYSEYNKQRDQIKSKVAGLVNRGYNVPMDIIPPTWGNYVKSKGKNPNYAEISRLKRIKTKDIYEKTTYTERDLDTGQTKEMSYKYHRDIERSQAAKKGSATKRRKKDEERIDAIIPPKTPIPDDLPKEDEIIISNLSDELDFILSLIYPLEFFESSAKNEKVATKNTNNVRESGGTLETELMNEYNSDPVGLLKRLSENSTVLQGLLSRPENFYKDPASNDILNDILVIIRGSSISFEEAKQYADASENTDYIDEEEWEDDLPF